MIWMSNVKILGRINQTQVAGAETARLILKESTFSLQILPISDFRVESYTSKPTTLEKAPHRLVCCNVWQNQGTQSTFTRGVHKI